MDNFTEEDKEHSIDVASDAGALEEVLRMILEIINSTLISQNKSNSNFIYTLLYHQHIFEPFHKHPNFQDLLQNIKTVSKNVYSVNSSEHRTKRPFNLCVLYCLFYS